uniref:Uncharacterized protein n=1 Tax=Rhizophora mucronata TaxID=61149 RepID=A0A2P2NLQ0_RHIMU
MLEAKIKGDSKEGDLRRKITKGNLSQNSQMHKNRRMLG